MDYHALNRYFEPPPAPRERWAWPGSMMLAGLLAAAVIWAARAPSPPVPVAFSAELWSPTAQQAAPAPPPPPPPAPAPAPTPQPAAPQAPPPAKAAAPAREGDIGTEKRRKDKEPSKAERDQAEKDRKAKEAKAAEEERRQEQLQAKQRADTLRRIREEAASATVKTEAKAAPAPTKAAPPSPALPQPPSPPVTPPTPPQAPPPAQTPPQTPRATPTPPTQATGTGASSDKGAAERSSAPSSSYVGKIIALIRDNTTFNEPNLSRYTVVVLVRTGPDGRIVKSEVVTSSGRPTFDEAVMRGIEKMVAVPRDIDGRIPELLLREGMLITVKFNR